MTGVAALPLRYSGSMRYERSSRLSSSLRASTKSSTARGGELPHFVSRPQDGQLRGTSPLDP